MKIIFALCLTLVFGVLVLGTWQVTNVILPSPEDQSNKMGIRNMLTKWVYNNSGQISTDTAEWIVAACMQTKRPLLMLALISAESDFIPSALSKKGAMGLTQVMFDVHKKMLIEQNIIKEKRDLFNIDANVRAGYYILEMYLKESNGNITKALEKYLGGRDGIYVLKILTCLANLYVLTGDLN